MGGGVDPASAAKPTEKGGAAFRALLDKLQSSADKLKGSEFDDAEGLADAVEGARTALTDALSVQEQLLEAYRQRLQQGGGA